jgi:hypothetical protein
LVIGRDVAVKVIAIGFGIFLALAAMVSAEERIDRHALVTRQSITWNEVGHAFLPDTLPFQRHRSAAPQPDTPQPMIIALSSREISSPMAGVAN